MKTMYNENIIAIYGEETIKNYIKDNPSNEIFDMYLNLLKEKTNLMIY